MISVLRFLVDAIFVFSVIFIWFMLLYQFVLTIGGFLWRRKTAREERKTPEGPELPKVSVLIPAHNEEKVIANLIACIQNFDYPRERIEILVLNDGSTDQTREIIERLAGNDPRIRLMNIPLEESRRGKAAVLNRGLKTASHEVVAVYDSDNMPDRDSLKKLCRALVANKRAAAVTGKFRVLNRRKNLLTRLINLETIAFQWLIQAGRCLFLKIAFLPGTNFVVWKRILEETGGWDVEALTEDSELTFRIYQKGWIISFLPDAVTWEQEPEKLGTWFRQRTRWARGNSYVIAKHMKRLFRSRANTTTFELVNLFFLYYFFVFAILFSDLLFVLSVLNVVHLRVMGPYAELWALAVFLFVLEMMIALSFEKEDSVGSLLVVVCAYLTYTKLWALVVLRGFYDEYIARRKRVWTKTERFDVDVPGSGPQGGKT